MPSRSPTAGMQAKLGRNWLARVALAGALASPACGTWAHDPLPVAALGDTTAAANAFTIIRERWNDRRDVGHERLRAEIDRFLAAYPTDGLVPLARVYHALSLTEEPADWPRVDTELAKIREPPPGTVRDLYLIASARQLRHHGQPDVAFDLLGPLVGKMVDAVARGALEEEVTHDALEAHHDYEAIAYMDAWLRGSPEEDRDVVHGKVAALLASMSDLVLENSLRAMRAAQSAGGYGVEIQRLVAQRLAEVAIAKGNAMLARWLLDPSAGPSLIGGPTGIQLGELATSRRGLGDVTGRTIGLLLPTGSTDLRDEAADVERGVAWALDLPRTNPDGGDGTRLITRDDGGDPARMVAGLEELAGDGASIILTALDSASADKAIEWGEQNHLAVITIAAPATQKPGAFSFVVGEPEQGVIDLLIAAVAKRRGVDAKVATVAEGDATKLIQGRPTSLLAPVSCDAEAARAGEPRFPVDAWDKASIRTWLVAGSADCARDVMREEEARGRAKGALFALTLIGSTTKERPAGARLLAAASGILPPRASRATAPPSSLGEHLQTGGADPRETDAAALTARFGGRPDWWTALGRDAGALARKALAAAPMDSVSTHAEIAKRREAARDALLSARDPLWSTNGEGFDGSHVLARDVRIVELSATP